MTDRLTGAPISQPPRVAALTPGRRCTRAPQPGRDAAAVAFRAEPVVENPAGTDEGLDVVGVCHKPPSELVAEGAPAWKLHQEIGRSRSAVWAALRRRCAGRW